MDESSWRRAIAEFQNFAGLNATGKPIYNYIGLSVESLLLFHNYYRLVHLLFICMKNVVKDNLYVHREYSLVILKADINFSLLFY